MQVLVIGAGVVGLAVARAAARRGHDVVVAEAESAIGTGTQCLTSFCGRSQRLEQGGDYWVRSSGLAAIAFLVAFLGANFLFEKW